MARTRGGAAPDPRADHGIVATAYLARSAALLARIAGLLGRTGDADRYGRLAAAVRDAWQREYLGSDGRLEAEHVSPYGPLRSARHRDRDLLRITVDVPSGTRAEIRLPDGRIAHAGPGNHHFTSTVPHPLTQGSAS